MNDSVISRFSTRLVSSLSARLAIPIVGSVVLITVASFFAVNQLQRNSAEERSIRTAESVVAQMLATRSVYTANIVAKLKSEGTEVGFATDFEQKKGFVPLPATLVHRISDKINDQGLYTIDLISPWPINPAKGPRTGWETEAINKLIDDPQKNQDRVLAVNGDATLEFMAADFGSAQGCVACHNAHPDSPKKDFQLGDMMGALVVRVPLTEEFAGARTEAAYLGVGILGVLGVLAVLLMWFLRRVVLRPIHRLTDASIALAEGDLASRVASNSRDEIGQVTDAFNRIVDYNRDLASASIRIAQGDLSQDVDAKSQKDELGNAYNQMIASLRGLVNRVGDVAVNLNDASGQLARASQEAGTSVQGIATSSQQVVKGAEEQLVRSQDVTTGMGELSSVIEQMDSGTQEQASAVGQAADIVTQVSKATEDVAKNAQSAADGSRQASEAADNGKDLVNRTVEGMDRIKNAVDTAANRIGELGEQSAEIGKIVNVIEDIAAQTNLLALNAAIEAARAGEQGRGFAVVADEVKKLAERVTDATQEIANLIDAVRSGVAESVKATEDGTKEVGEGATLAIDAGVALDQISESVTLVAAQIEEISAASHQVSASSVKMVETIGQVSGVVEQNAASTQQMAASSTQVNESVDGIGAAMQQNSAAIQEMAASTEDVSAQVQELVAASGSLDSMAKELRESVATFKIDRAMTTEFEDAD